MHEQAPGPTSLGIDGSGERGRFDGLDVTEVYGDRRSLPRSLAPRPGLGRPSRC